MEGVNSDKTRALQLSVVKTRFVKRREGEAEPSAYGEYPSSRPLNDHHLFFLLNPTRRLWMFLVPYISLGTRNSFGQVCPYYDAKKRNGSPDP